VASCGDLWKPWRRKEIAILTTGRLWSAVAACLQKWARTGRGWHGGSQACTVVEASFALVKPGIALRNHRPNGRSDPQTNSPYLRRTLWPALVRPYGLLIDEERVDVSSVG